VSIPACVSIMKEDVYIETYDEVVKAFRPGAKKEKKDEKEKKDDGMGETHVARRGPLWRRRRTVESLPVSLLRA
jgi:hypothetical protein